MRRGLDRFLTRESARQALALVLLRVVVRPRAYVVRAADRPERRPARAGCRACRPRACGRRPGDLGRARRAVPHRRVGDDRQPAGELRSPTPAPVRRTARSPRRAPRASCRCGCGPARPGAHRRARPRSPTSGAAGLVHVAGATGLRLGVPGADLWLGALAAGETVTLPEAPRVYAFVATGCPHPLEPGRAARGRRRLRGHRPGAPAPGHRGGADPAAGLDVRAVSPSPASRSPGQVREPARRG